MRIIINTLVLLIFAAVISACNGSDPAAPKNNGSDSTFSGKNELPKVTVLPPAVAPSNETVVLPSSIVVQLPDLKGEQLKVTTLPQAVAPSNETVIAPPVAVDGLKDLRSDLAKLNKTPPAVAPSNETVVLPPQATTAPKDLGPIVWPLPLPEAQSAATPQAVQVGVRPYFLVDDMSEGELKTKLKSCADGPFKRTDFAIAHRGAPLQFPEHTKEGYLAAIRMGAGILECDVTFTKDKQLVCRHAQCDLNDTTNIQATALKGKCTGGRCCTSDITLAEFKTLRGMMEAPTKDWRTDLYANRSGTLMSHAESIALFDAAGVKMTPELKNIDRSIAGYSLDDYRQQVVDEYKAAKIDPSRVSIQSFNLPDILYWIKNEPEFGKGASYLIKFLPDPTSLAGLYAQGVRTISSSVDGLAPLVGEKYVPTAAALAAKKAGFELVGYTMERDGMPGNTGDMTYGRMDVLAKDVGVKGVFSDWVGTTSYYASCMGLK